MLTEKQIEERKSGIGGSDVHHLFSEKPYGCSRKLFYEKTGQEADHPVTDTGVMERGNVLEPVTADFYVKETGHKIVRRNEALVHKDYPWARANVDRLIHNDPRGVGVLECKTAGREMFFKIKKEGLPSSYILQLQWYLFVTGYKWGAFAVLWADGWQFLHFEVERDGEMIKHLLDAGQSFWRNKDNRMPPRLDSSDKRCKTCPFRTTCQGEALLNAVSSDNGEIPTDYSLDDLVNEFIRYKEIVDEATELMEGSKLKLKEAIGDRPAVDTHGYRIHFAPFESNRFDTRRFKKDHPELAEKYLTKNVYRPLKTYAK